MVVQSIRSDKTAHQRNLINQFRHCTKRFYGYMRSMRSVKSKVSHIKKPQDGSLTTTDQEAATVLCDYFSSVFTQETDLTNGLPSGSDGLHTIEVTEEHVLKVLLKLKPDKSPGPDNIHPMLLQNLLNLSTSGLMQAS